MFKCNIYRGCITCSEGCKYCNILQPKKTFENGGVAPARLKSVPEPMSYFLNGDPHVPSFARCYVNTTSDTFLEATDR